MIGMAKEDKVINIIKQTVAGAANGSLFFNNSFPEFDDEYVGQFLNWLKHNKKVFAAGEMKEDRVVKFKALIELCERYRRKNQYE